MTEHNAPRLRRPGLVYRLMMGFLGLFDRWLHFSCRAFTRLASEKYERRLTRGERMRQAVHRAMCGLCRLHERRLDQVRELAGELAQHTETDEPSSVELSPEAHVRIRHAMEAAQRRGGGSS